MTLDILIGPPGCGKSTLARQFLQQNPELKILSSDAMRAEFGTGEDDQSVTGRVFSTLKKRLLNYLESSEDVVIDATNINRKDRSDYIKYGKQYGAKITAHSFEYNKKFLLARNHTRGLAGGRNVPEFVIDRMLNKYQCPTKEEGFDSINIYVNEYR